MGGMVDYIVQALRGGQKDAKPMPKQAEGYRLYLKEAELNGEKPVPYDVWLKTLAADLGSPQQ